MCSSDLFPSHDTEEDKKEEAETTKEESKETAAEADKNNYKNINPCKITDL